eukprot:1191362-Prorocentrum_minimum.AAC.2
MAWNVLAGEHSFVNKATPGCIQFQSIYRISASVPLCRSASTEAKAGSEKSPPSTAPRRRTAATKKTTKLKEEVVDMGKPKGDTGFDEKRLMILKKGKIEGEGPVIYWTGRDQRAEDNWALIVRNP